MNFNEKYNFKIKYDQFGNQVDNNFYDVSEETLISYFEQNCIDLQKENKKEYSMIELGSNQAYYSCLFKGILGNEKTKNILVEPVEYAMIRGKENFKLNNYSGVFLSKCIGDSWGINKNLFETRLPSDTFGVEDTTVKEIMNNYQLVELDILHCDIDQSELHMLETSADVFKNKNVNNVYILTHQTHLLEHDYLHNQCKEFLLNCNYNLVYELRTDEGTQGGDGLLIFKK